MSDPVLAIDVDPRLGPAAVRDGPVAARGYHVAMTPRLALDVDGVVAALQSMTLPAGLTACALIIGFDDETQQYVAHVALILAFDEWTDAAVKACERANAAAWEALAPLDVVPNLLCRLRTEHEDLKSQEPEWLPITDGNC